MGPVRLINDRIMTQKLDKRTSTSPFDFGKLCFQHPVRPFTSWAFRTVASLIYISNICPVLTALSLPLALPGHSSCFVSKLWNLLCAIFCHDSIQKGWNKHVKWPGQDLVTECGFLTIISRLSIVMGQGAPKQSPLPRAATSDSFPAIPPAVHCAKAFFLCPLPPCLEGAPQKQTQTLQCMMMQISGSVLSVLWVWSASCINIFIRLLKWPSSRWKQCLSLIFTESEHCRAPSRDSEHKYASIIHGCYTISSTSWGSLLSRGWYVTDTCSSSAFFSRITGKEVHLPLWMYFVSKAKRHFLSISLRSHCN